MSVKNNKMLRFGVKVIALFNAILLGVGVLTLAAKTPAFAQELPLDEGKIVATKQHVDSPKVFYENSAFVLKAGVGSEIHPLENTINFFSHGYSRGSQVFIFEIPDHAPELEFLGAAGEAWYMAHYNTVGRHTIWAGVGADVAIPAEEFRDSVFTLDLIDVRGPGRVEMFGWTEADDTESVGLITRMFSSTDSRFKSFLMTPGNHTHNYTVFEKPGRYQMVYRASARTKDGKLISGPEQVMQWQVGGNEPAKILPTQSAHNSANAPAGLSIKNSVNQPQDVAQHMRELSYRVPANFAADKLQNAYVQFTVNGYHLANVSLVNKIASWNEVLGSSKGIYQAILRDKNGAELLRSAPLEYIPGKDAHTQEFGQQVTPIKTAQQTVYKEIEYTGEPGFQVNISPSEYADARKIEVVFADPQLLGNVKIATKADAQATVLLSSASFNVGGHKSFTFHTPWDSDDEDNLLFIEFVPHPLAKNLSSVTHVVTSAYESGKTYQAAVKVPVQAPNPADLGTGNGANGANPGNAAGGANTNPAPSGAHTKAWGDRALIKKGHLDIAAVFDGQLELVLRDESGQLAAGAVNRKLDDVAIAVPDAARLKRIPESLQNKFGDMPLWVLPETQNLDLPWPGYSTERVAAAAVLPGSINLELVEMQGPGEFALFESDAFGEYQTLLESFAGGKRQLALEAGVHAHAAWAFNKPGVYEITFRYSATDSNGAELATAPQKIMFVVGDAVLSAADSHSGQGAGSGADNSVPGMVGGAESSGGANSANVFSGAQHAGQHAANLEIGGSGAQVFAHRANAPKRARADFAQAAQAQVTGVQEVDSAPQAAADNLENTSNAQNSVAAVQQAATITVDNTQLVFAVCCGAVLGGLAGAYVLQRLRKQARL